MLKSLSLSAVGGGWEKDDLLCDETIISQCVPAAGFLAASPRAVTLKGEVTMPSQVPAVTSRVVSPPKRKLFHLICSHHEWHRLSVGEASCNWKGLGAFVIKPFVVAAVKDNT